MIGGYLYRGPVTWLQGLYVFADFISDHVWAFDPADPAGTIVLLDDALTPGIGAIDNIAGFGEDAAGHLYMTSLNGSVVLLVPEPATVLMWLAGLAGLGAWRRRVRAPGCR